MQKILSTNCLKVILDQVDDYHLLISYLSIKLIPLYQFNQIFKNESIEL
jgi:hypothetical protein